MGNNLLTKLSSCCGLLIGYLLLAILPLFSMGQGHCIRQNQSPSSQPPITATMPDLQQLATMAGGGFAPVTDEQLAEEKQIVSEQIAEARVWLEDADAQQRINGAQQLSAYPTLEAEHLLVATLATDADAGVRIAAIESLGFIKKPKTATIDALLAAMQDMDEDVRFNAFNTLQTLVNRAETDPKTGKKILAQLKRLMVKGMVDSDSRDAIREFLQDQDAL
jgi:hypothetical protein